MTDYTPMRLEELDRAIAQEINLPAGDIIPPYTTDLNVAIPLMMYHHSLYHFRDKTGEWWQVINAVEKILSEHHDPALAICMARWPHLFEDMSERTDES